MPLIYVTRWLFAGALFLHAAVLSAAEFGLSASSYLGDISNDDEVYGAQVLADGTIVLAVNLNSATPGGLAPVLLNGATASTPGALVRLTRDGRTVLGVTRFANAVYDLSLDGSENLLVAAGSEGVFKLNGAADTILASATVGGFVSRVDGAQDDHVVALRVDNPGDFDQKAGKGRIFLFDSSLSAIHDFQGWNNNTIDVAIDSVSETIFLIGFTNKFTWGGPGFGPSTPVDVTGLLGVPYLFRSPGFEDFKWRAYDWDDDVWLDEARTIPNPRYINGPFDLNNLTADRYPLSEVSKMADTRGYRVEVAPDGYLYAAMEFDGGNHAFNFDPFTLVDPAQDATGDPYDSSPQAVTVPVVRGDIFHQESNTTTVPKVHWGRYDPATGELLLNQIYTNRLEAESGPPNDNTIRMKGGSLWADENGRVYLAGASAGGLAFPANSVYSPKASETTFDPFGPGNYTGGAYVIIMSPDFTTREYVTRLATGGNNRAIVGRVLVGETDAVIAWGGEMNLSQPLFTYHAVQPNPGYGQQDGAFAVLGGDLFDGSDGFTFEIDFGNGYVPSNRNLRDQNETQQVIDLDGDGADDSRAGYAYRTDVPLSPTNGYTGPAFFGGFWAEGLDHTDVRLNDHKVATSRLEIRVQPSSPDTARSHGVFLVPASELGVAPGDVLDFAAGSTIEFGFNGDPAGPWRVLVRDGTTLYVSEETRPSSLGFSLDIEDGNWAVWEVPEDMNFDADAAMFLPQNFSDVTGLGFIVDQDGFTSSRFFMRWEFMRATMRLNGSDNTPPTAQFTSAPNRGVHPLLVNFDGSSSFDSDGAVNFFTWRFGDGAQIGGPVVSHTYEAAGRFLPELEVFDEQLAFDVASQPVDALLGLSSDLDAIFASWGGNHVDATRRLLRPFSQMTDLDNDGNADDEFDGFSFSASEPITQGEGARLFGGVFVEAIDGTVGVADDDLRNNGSADEIEIRLQNQSSAGFRYRALFYIDESQFLSTGTEPITFDGDSEVLLRIAGRWDIGGNARWLLKEGEDFYLSEATIAGSQNTIVSLGFPSATDHGRWASYDPTVANGNFDQAGATFATKQFTDVTGVGIYLEVDGYSTARRWFSFSGIEATQGAGAASVATYLDWAEKFFDPADLANPSLEATVWGEEANFDGDYPNAIQALFALDPTVEDGSGAYTVERDGDDIILRFRVRTAVDGVPYQPVWGVESSSTLAGTEWETILDGSACDLVNGCTQGLVTLDIVGSGPDYVEVEVRVPAISAREFLRITVF